MSTPSKVCYCGSEHRTDGEWCPKCELNHPRAMKAVENMVKRYGSDRPTTYITVTLKNGNKIIVHADFVAGVRV